ncbi:MAG: hypothetical protein V1846_02030, partial [Candidatus Komeilibacteria bacterium]
AMELDAKERMRGFAVFIGHAFILPRLLRTGSYRLEAEGIHPTQIEALNIHSETGRFAKDYLKLFRSFIRSTSSWQSRQYTGSWISSPHPEQ